MNDKRVIEASQRLSQAFSTKEVLNREKSVEILKPRAFEWRSMGTRQVILGEASTGPALGFIVG